VPVPFTMSTTIEGALRALLLVHMGQKDAYTINRATLHSRIGYQMETFDIRVVRVNIPNGAHNDA
jgi:hypothetical protein